MAKSERTAAPGTPTRIGPGTPTRIGPGTPTRIGNEPIILNTDHFATPPTSDHFMEDVEQGTGTDADADTDADTDITPPSYPAPPPPAPAVATTVPVTTSTSTSASSNTSSTSSTGTSSSTSRLYEMVADFSRSLQLQGLTMNSFGGLTSSSSSSSASPASLMADSRRVDEQRSSLSKYYAVLHSAALKHQATAQRLEAKFYLGQSLRRRLYPSETASADGET